MCPGAAACSAQRPPLPRHKAGAWLRSQPPAPLVPQRPLPLRPPAGAGAANPNRQTCMAIYGAYFVIPLLIALHMGFSRIPFPAAKKKKLA